MVKGISPEPIVLPGGAQALQTRSFLSSLMGRPVSANGQRLFPVIPGLSRKAEERGGKEEGKKPSRERPCAPCLRDGGWLLGWEDAAGSTPDLDDAEASAGTAPGAVQHAQSQAAVPGHGNVVPARFGELPPCRAEE